MRYTAFVNYDRQYIFQEIKTYSDIQSQGKYVLRRTKCGGLIDICLCTNYKH